MKLKTLLSFYNIYLLAFVGIAVLMPFAMNLLSYPITLWLLMGIILSILNRKDGSSIRLHPAVAFLMLYYFMTLTGYFISRNKEEAVFDAQVKLTLFLLPVAALFFPKLRKDHKDWVMFLFTAANVAAGLVCLLVAFSNSSEYSGGVWQFHPFIAQVSGDTNTAPPSWFTYTNLSLFKHPSYFSMYLSLGIFFLADLKRRDFPLFRKSRGWILLVFMALIILSLITLLQSKAGYFSLFLLVFIVLVVWLTRKKYLLRGMIPLFILLIGAGFWFKDNSRFYYVSQAFEKRQELMGAIRNRDYQTIIEGYGIDRIALWLISLDASRDHPWIGCGSGDVHDELNLKFREQHLHMLEQQHYNSHNQFIETLLAQGIAGLSLLLAALFFPLVNKRTWTFGAWLPGIFLGLLILNFMFESMLNSFSGVIFTAFFFTFFFGIGNDEKAPTPKAL